MEQEKKKENIVAGLVGAFLGSLLGAVCIVLIGQMGYVASIGGLVMAVCTLKGYELLGGVLSRKGAAVASAFTLVMTYVAYQMDCAIQVAQAAGVGVFEAFRSMNYLLAGGYLETRVYWGGLVMLYLFTLLGAVPMLVGAFRGDRELAIPSANTHTAPGQEEMPASQYYPANPSWTRPLRRSMLVTLLAALVLLFLPLMLFGVQGDYSNASLGMMAGGFLGAMVMVFTTLALNSPCEAIRWIFVRSGGQLWRVDLTRLNTLDTYRFTRKNGNFRVLQWNKLTAEEQERAKQSIQRAIQVLCTQGVMPGSALGMVVRCLPDPQLVRESKWTWKISYGLGRRDGDAEQADKRKNMVIGKGYPNFAPVPGTEAPTGAMPGRWLFCILSIVMTLVLIGCGYLIGAANETGGLSLPFGSDGGSLEERVPETTMTYEQLDVRFQLDATFEPGLDNYFIDPATGVGYTISVRLGATEEQAVDTLLQPIGTYRASPAFVGFSFAYPGEEEDLVTLTAEDQTVYLHNMLTIQLNDNGAFHTAVALTQDELGTMIVVEASHDGTTDEKTVKETILYILRHSELTGPTEKNYQSLYHVGQEMGYEHVGIAFIRSPYEDVDFMRVPLPYSETVEYMDDGQAILASAHGLRVYADAFYSPEGPQPILEEAYAAIEAEGRDLSPEGIFDIDYDAEVDMAVKQIAFWEGSDARISFLVAQPMQREGYYRYMEITYLPEDMDDIYPELIEELSDASDLSLPELDPF